MNTVKILGLSALLLGATTAWAQQAPATDAPPIRSDAAPSPNSASPRSPASKATAQSEAGEPRADTSNAHPEPSERAPTTTRSASPAGAKPANPKATAADKLQLGTATVTGDREQPKVMYVVPWKRADIGDPEGKPMNSLVDEILSPVDRDVFRREVRYYQTVNSQASQNGASPAAGQVEK